MLKGPSGWAWPTLAILFKSYDQISKVGFWSQIFILCFLINYFSRESEKYAYFQLKLCPAELISLQAVVFNSWYCNVNHVTKQAPEGYHWSKVLWFFPVTTGKAWSAVAWELLWCPQQVAYEISTESKLRHSQLLSWVGHVPILLYVHCVCCSGNGCCFPWSSWTQVCLCFLTRRLEVLVEFVSVYYCWFCQNSKLD